MSKVKAEWTGSFPNLCIGEWKLIIDGNDLSDKIPEKIRSDHMWTYGTYDTWHFDNNWNEVWETYTDGLPEEEWLEKNESWLSAITTDQEVLGEIFRAFQSEDWRHSSCGGCI